MHDLKARKLARLPGDKCRREEDSHADIGRLLSSSLLHAASCFQSCGSLVTSCTRRVYIAYLHACIVLTARLLTYREEMPRTHVSICALTHARIHSGLILLEATDAPISARVSFVIRENVNQSPGPRRLLFLRASSLLLYSLVVSRMYVCEYVLVSLLILYVSSNTHTTKNVRRLSGIHVATSFYGRVYIYIYIKLLIL